MATVNDFHFDPVQLRVYRGQLLEILDADAGERSDEDIAAIDGVIDVLDRLLAATPAQPIRRVFFNGETAGEEMVSFDEFAHVCIQDHPVALEAVARMIAAGEYAYSDEAEQIAETYTIIDRDLLYEQLADVHPEDLELAGLDPEQLKAA